MTALYMDGFDHYGTGVASQKVMLSGSWAGVSNNGCITPSYGARTGDYCLQSQFNGASQYNLPSTKSHLFISLGFSVPSSGYKGDIVRFNSNGVKLQVTQYGYIQLVDNNDNVLGITSGSVITSGRWFFLEMEYNTSGGVFVLRVDDADLTGTPVLNLSSLTLSSVSGLYFIGQLGTYDTMYMDDLFIRDSSGTKNNSWLGDRRVSTAFASTDTTSAGWTPSYNQKFGAGTLRLGYTIASDTTIYNPSSCLVSNAATSLDIGSNAFTLETFVKFDALPTTTNYSTIFNRWDTTNNKRSYRLVYGGPSFNSSCLQFDISTDGTTSTTVTKIQYPWTPLTDVWYHIALVRVSNQLLLFVDGVQMGLPISDSATYYSGGTEVFSIGAEAVSSSNVVTGSNLAGRLDETRFTNGVGRYSGTFTPPTAAFTRGVSDTSWSSVVLLMGYDSGIVDESSFVRDVAAVNGASQYLPVDSATLGQYSTINEPAPDDHNFISAPLINATSIFTMTVQPSTGDTVRVGTKDGTTAATYTFKTAISTAFDVLIDTTAQGSLTNLLNAINAGTGIGTKYGTGTTANFDVTATALPTGQFKVTANLAGTSGNSVATTKTGTAASWTGTTLAGGTNIPSYSQFKFGRPPNNTTIISAIQLVTRAAKTDSGTSTIQASLVGSGGGVGSGSTHALAISVNDYSDIIELDPDTSSSITPSTLVNGFYRINRTA